jgi:hypothetical protein
MLRISYCVENLLTDGGECVSLTRRQRFTPINIFWYSFLLEAEQTPGPSAAGKIRKIEKKSVT